jgi:hypothetical protein
MANKVRILRNRVPFRDAVWRLNKLLFVFLGIWARAQQAEERAHMEALRCEKIRKDMEVAEMRRQKLMNELVIQDLKIEELNIKAGHPVPPEWTYKGNNLP